MAERTTITQIAQLAPEAVPGTPLAATKVLQSLMLVPDIQVDVNNYRPSGFKYDTIVVPNQEWTTFKATGPATFSECVYPLSGILTLPTPAVAGAIADPTTAPTGAPSATGGTLATGSYTYKYADEQNGGLTLPSTASAAQAVTGPTGSVALSGILPGDATTTSRYVYRSDGGGYFLIGIIPDNTTTAFTDTGFANGAAAPTVNTTGAATWLFQPSSTQPDVVQTYTVEHGSSVRADRASYGTWDSYGESWDRKAVTLTGSMLAQQLSDPFTLTAGLPSVENIPVLPKQVDVFLDTSFGALGTTKLLRALTVSFNLASRFGPFWTLNSANASFAGTVETVPKGTVTLKLAADAAGMALLSTLRAGGTYFLRVQATGTPLYGTVTYLKQYDFAIKLGKPTAFADTDGIVDISWAASIVHDASWGRAMQASITNRVFAL